MRRLQPAGLCLDRPLWFDTVRAFAADRHS